MNIISIKHLSLYLLLLASSSAIAQPYDDIMSDWCKMGLRGRVKEMRYTQLTPNISGKKLKSSYITLKFSPKGYITEKTTEKKNKKAITNKYAYQHNDSSYIATISYLKGGKLKPQYTYRLFVRRSNNNTVTQSFPNDSLGIQENLHKYNNQQQIVLEIYTSTKKYGVGPTKTFEYDEEGYRVKELWQYNFTQEHIENEIVTKDKKDNLTLLNSTTTSKNETNILSIKKDITYTYYD